MDMVKKKKQTGSPSVGGDLFFSYRFTISCNQDLGLKDPV